MDYREALNNMGYQRDPFGSALAPERAFSTEDSNRAAEAIYRAADEKALISIVAPAGAGKSTMLAGALAGLAADTHIVCPPVLEAERLGIRQIQWDIVGTIQGDFPEKFPRDASRRARLTSRTLGQAAGKPVILAIDEAHLLNSATLSAIKRLWNLTWLGRSPLLSIVLVGQTPLLTKLGDVWELGGRTEIIRMTGLTVSEGASYIAHRLEPVAKGLFDEEAMLKVARLCPIRTPLALNSVCRRAVQIAAAMGHKAVTVSDVESAAGVWDTRIQLLRDAQIDISELAKKAGVTRSKVRQHLASGKEDRESKTGQKIESALDQLLEAQTQGA